METKRRYFTASEINQFTFCKESWRLTKLKKEGKIRLRDQDYQILNNRFRKGNEHHKEYHAKRAYQPKSSSVGRVLLYVFVLVVILWIVQHYWF
ncbi:hypothetical protein [Jeotgalibacillus proteolyticus]|uniref:Uncharacterized protein n=1 Tax=Jeotgalibacillus proteolyticus TaxID=2082395 RepID=A0A2S5G6Y7_9BACL|nr:hypothetical protein [Jeotgalibacillus proteolyticus]PPA68694.1 hypothetical protein C4B60_19175 [Jeotgalibacillus proteolyticus]PPA68771.1 hypothetical protein C4B60_19605 [Jeotgalibacillus proteolyticus]